MGTFARSNVECGVFTAEPFDSLSDISSLAENITRRPILPASVMNMASHNAQQTVIDVKMFCKYERIL
jgi:hypothetical protein